MDFEFQEEDSDIMMRLQGEDGHELTLITAPASTFDDPEDLGPNVYGLGDQIVVAFNEEVMQQMIEKSIIMNAEDYGQKASTFLPMIKIMNLAMEKADEYIKSNQGDN